MQEDFKSRKPEQLEALKTLLGKSDTAESSEFADWFDGKKIDEIALCEYLLRKKERKCIHGRLYDPDGEIEDETVRKEILDEIRPYQKTNVAKTVERILNTLKLMCQCENQRRQDSFLQWDVSSGRIFFRRKRMDNEPASCQI